MSFPSLGLVHRSTVTGRRGMVAAGHPLACLAGMRLLLQGGNAVDAAVATAAALNVVEPYMSGIAGVGYLHLCLAGTAEHLILDYIGLTPAAADIGLYDTEEARDRGPLSPLVPGACAGWLEALRRWGTVDAATAFAPAIEYALGGFPLTVRNSEFFAASAPDLQRFPAARSTYLPRGAPPHPGDILVQADLARTLRQVAEGGEEFFYRGEFAGRLVRHLQETGGLMTDEDLAGFRTRVLEPVEVDYRGYRVLAPPPPCQAVQFLETLNILEGFDVAGMGHNTVQTLHVFLEATKLAMADRAAYAALPDPPTAGLLSREYAAQRRALIGERSRPTPGERFARAVDAQEVGPGHPPAWRRDECTTHFDVVDQAGNAVAVTQSLGSGFGAGMVVPGTGVALNNFMRWFDLEPSSPNAVGPRKRIEMCLSPAMVRDGRGLRLLLGTPGSHGILQTTPQMLMNVVDHGMNIQAAIEAPRAKTGRPGHGVDVETRIPAAVLAGLEERGHQLFPAGDWSYTLGGGQGITVDPDSGAFMGGADPRRDGYALGW
ncbi:MAG: gamma-glutamyltransferase [Candidatus Latescibacterota bacterium]